MDARKGLATPPVVCGRRPTPTVDPKFEPLPAEPPNPVGCAFKAPSPVDAEENPPNNGVVEEFDVDELNAPNEGRLGGGEVD